MPPFGRKQRDDPYAPQPAAAFSRKKKDDVYEFNEDAPKWGIRNDSNVGGSWTTYDPKRDSFKYDERFKEGNTENAMFEEWTGMKFIPDKYIMNDNRAKNEWEVRNRGTLAVGASFKNISVEIGDDIVNSRGSSRVERAMAGKAPQMEKKRVLDERNRRLEEKREEEKIWKEREERWNAMSYEEKDAVRQKRREDRLRVMEGFRITVVPAYPEDVNGIGIDLANLTLDPPSMDVDYSERGSSRTSMQTVRPRGNRSRSPGSSARSPRDQRPPPPNWPAAEHWIERGSASTASPRSYQPLLESSLPTPPQYTLTQRSRYPGSQAESIFEVGHHPPLEPPPEDIDMTFALTNEEIAQHEAKLQKIWELNAKHGRMVTVRVDPKVTVSFPEAVTDRLWGGMIQEIIFHPASKHAVVIFVTASGCAAFLRHWRSIRDHDSAELRRTQIAVAWYDDSEQSAILPPHGNILGAICYDGATRVLVIRNIYKDIKKTDAEDGFRRSVGLDRVICKGRLVVPTKAYEKQSARSNVLVMEFASVRDAIDVKEAVNNNQIGPDFRDCTASFGKDPTDKPPVTRSYCKCRWCKGRGATAAAGTTTATSIAASTAASTTTGTPMQN